MEVTALLHPIHRWSQPWMGADAMELAPIPEGGDLSARTAAHLALKLLA